MGEVSTRRTVLVAGVLAGIARLWAPRHGSAAEEVGCAIPPAVATARAEGTTVESIGHGAPLSTPGHSINLYRFSLPPGGNVPPHRHPGATLLAVESGALAYTLLRGTASIQRGTGDEVLSVGTEMILRPGDALFYDADTAHTARNPGKVPVVVLSVTLLATDQPATILTDEHGMELT
ncbi:MAG: hypothetical protein QOF33_434 [Thermomicrobiales bacterium]|nr:hypothetical protein [Thermomicrobiales bacterium]MEA2523633.1 hypothetical protein [Thermomicrobiales bacterium]MEA2582349.1 hypothetical protein [Thermomicrobiales bacterium]